MHSKEAGRKWADNVGSWSIRSQEYIPEDQCTFAVDTLGTGRKSGMKAAVHNRQPQRNVDDLSGGRNDPPELCREVDARPGGTAHGVDWPSILRKWKR